MTSTASAAAGGSGGGGTKSLASSLAPWLPGSVVEEVVRTPRTGYSLQKQQSELKTMEMMMNLDAPSIALIKSEFVDAGGELDMVDFVRVMRRHLPLELPADPDQARQAEKELVANLCELFKEIDVNGDKMMEWDEFTSFIVDKAVVFKDDSHIDAIAGYKEVPQHVDEASGRRRQVHHEAIERIKYIPKLNSICVLEYRTPVIKLYSANTLEPTGQLRGHGGIPEAVEYFSHNSNSFCVASCADSTMALWDLNPGQRQFSFLTCWPTPHVQMSLCWAEQYTTLYSGSTTGLVHSWDVRSREETSCMAGHSDIVMDLISIPQLDNVASASLDSTICMWDMCSGAMRQCMRGHEKGVLSLAYSGEFRVLLSAGFDHDAMVWSPFVPSMLYKLKGHSSPLVGVRSVPGKPEVVTASVDGQYKIWDLRSFKCVQTFMDEHAALQPVASFEHVPSLRRIVSATKAISLFEQGGEKILTNTTDELPVTCALFNTTSMTILTASGRSVRIWNALTGTLMRVYRDICDTDITSICLDDRQRKFIAGEANGSVRVYNYANGAVMKSMVSHSREVSKLIYCNSLKVVISCSWDRTIVVHDEMDPEKGTVLRMMDQMRRHSGDISCGDWSHEASVVATGASDKTVRVWDVETGKLEAVFPHPGELVSLLFLAPHPLVVSADSSGNLFMWGVRTSVCKYACAMAWSQNPGAFMQIQGIDGTGKPLGSHRASMHHILLPKTVEASYGAAMAWDPTTETLFVGDERGQITAWDLSAAIHTVNSDSIKPTNYMANPSVDARAAETQIVALYSGPETVTVKWVIRAHKDGITSLQVVQEPRALISASYDTCVYSWTLDGVESGLLCRALRNGRNPIWNLDVDVAARAGRESEETNTAMDEASTRDAKDELSEEKQALRATRSMRLEGALSAGAHMPQKGLGPEAGLATAILGTGLWAAEAEASRHRNRMKMAQGGNGATTTNGTETMPSSTQSSRKPSVDGTRTRSRQRPSVAAGSNAAPAVPENPLAAAQASWPMQATELTKPAKKRVETALKTMTSSSMIGAMKGAAPTSPTRKRSVVPGGTDADIIAALNDSPLRKPKAEGRSESKTSGRTSRLPSLNPRGPRESALDSARSGVSHHSSSAASVLSSARSQSNFNPKTLEAAARLAALLQDY